MGAVFVADYAKPGNLVRLTSCMRPERADQIGRTLSQD
jgi:hypothetical protein